MLLLKMVKPSNLRTPYLHTQNGFGWTIGEPRYPGVFAANDQYKQEGRDTTPRLCTWTVLHAFLSFEQAFFCADQCGTKQYPVALLSTSTSKMVMSGNKVGVQELTPIADVTDQAPSWFPKKDWASWPTRGSLKKEFSFVRGTKYLGYDAGPPGILAVIYRHVTGRRMPSAHQYTASQKRRITVPYHDELIRFWTEQMPALYAGIKGEPPVHLAELYTPQEGG